MPPSYEEFATQERVTYETVWKDPEYREAAHGLWFWTTHREEFPETFRSALDIGCGTGRLLAAWNATGIDAWAVDIAENALDPAVKALWRQKFRRSTLWEMSWSRSFDVGCCADVMEHIPTAMVPHTLRAIAACCDVVLFKIAGYPSRGWGVNVNLHPTVRSAEWWQRQLEAQGGVTKQLMLPTDRQEYFFQWTAGAAVARRSSN